MYYSDLGRSCNNTARWLQTTRVCVCVTPFRRVRSRKWYHRAFVRHVRTIWILFPSSGVIFKWWDYAVLFIRSVSFGNQWTTETHSTWRSWRIYVTANTKIALGNNVIRLSDIVFFFLRLISTIDDNGRVWARARFSEFYARGPSLNTRPIKILMSNKIILFVVFYSYI